MNRINFRKYFFLYTKAIMLLVVLTTTIVSSSLDDKRMSLYLLIFSMFFATSLTYECLKKKEIIIVIVEFIVVLFMYYSGFPAAIYYGMFALLDLILAFRLPGYLFLFVSIIPIGIGYRLGVEQIDLVLLLIIGVLGGVIYYQEYMIIRAYQRDIQENALEESKLKLDMQNRKQQYEMKERRSRLMFENQMLTEKAEISQALHDKLGHSINGSIYQLEACKVILDKKPEESKKILQVVIDSLRYSMDEIRLILRREKPSKKQMSLVQLQTLCEECREKYGIDATLDIRGNTEQVPEYIWENILDNSYEAVSNALKYAKCTRIQIDIQVLNQVIRCTIKDNGIGCEKLTEGMGIQGIKNRIRNVNGYLDITSEDGFQINMILPLAQK